MNKLEILGRRIYQCDKPNINGTQIITYGYLVTSKDDTHPTNMQAFEQGKRIGYVCGYIQDIIADGVYMHRSRLSLSQLSVLEGIELFNCTRIEQIEDILAEVDSVFQSIGLKVV